MRDHFREISEVPVWKGLLNDLLGDRSLSCAGLTFDDRRFPFIADVHKDLIEVRWLYEREFRHTFRPEYFLNWISHGRFFCITFEVVAPATGSATPIQVKGFSLEFNLRLAAGLRVVQPRLVCAQHGHVVNGVQVPCRNTRT